MIYNNTCLRCNASLNPDDHCDRRYQPEKDDSITWHTIAAKLDAAGVDVAQFIEALDKYIAEGGLDLGG